MHSANGNHATLAAADSKARRHEEKAAKKKVDQATAARIAGELFALPKQQRMAALIKVPVEDRAAFAANVGGDQRNLLVNDFSPREREVR